MLTFTTQRAWLTCAEARARNCLLVLLALGVSACTESTEPPQLQTAPITTSRSIVIDPETEEWDAFDADVNVSYYGQSAGTSLPDPSRAVGYHVHRYQDGSGGWRSDFTHGNYRPTSNVDGESADPPRIARAYGAGASATPSFYDVNGAYVSLEEPAPVQPYGSSEYVPVAAASGPQPPPPPGSMYLTAEPGPGPISREGRSRRGLTGIAQSGAMRPANGVTMNAQGGLGPARVIGGEMKSRAWLDRYVVTAKAAERNRDRLTKDVGPGQADPQKGVKRFKLTRGKHAVEIDLDDAHGFIRESRVTLDGKLQAVTVREYAPGERGMRILKKERITRMLPDGRSRIMEVEYSNVKLSKKEK